MPIIKTSVLIFIQKSAEVGTKMLCITRPETVLRVLAFAMLGCRLGQQTCRSWPSDISFVCV
jgi:hypothetical protein